MYPERSHRSLLLDLSKDDLRYHKDKEYRDLTQEQRDEIDLWRKLGKPKTMPKPGTKPPANGNKWKKGKPNDEQAMISAVNKAVADQLKAIKSKETAEAETEAKSSSLLHGATQEERHQVYPQ